MVDQPAHDTSIGAVEALKYGLKLSKHVDGEAEGAVISKKTRRFMMKDEYRTSVYRIPNKNCMQSPLLQQFHVSNSCNPRLYF